MVAKIVDADVAGLVGLFLTMPVLAGFLLASRRPNRTVWLVLVSLYVSRLGDWLATLSNPTS